jgi:hypothetical protein
MDKLDRALFAAQVICWIEYLAILAVFILVEPYFIPFIVFIAIFLSLPVWVAYELMKSRLKVIKEPRITKLWAKIALILVPFSIVFYIVSTVLVIYGFIQNLWGNEWIGVIFLTSGFLGLCMPFVLLTYWVKYRYREDEF